jgi:phosphoglycerol transferase MdoB-like AlkP superfamily enzyme
MFIIPFAIFMSLLASLLNFVSVIVLSLIVIMRFMKLDTKIFITTNLVKVVLYATIIYYPYKIGKDNKVLEQYKIFQKNHDSKFINFYVEAMNWILVVENFSYNKLYKLKYK